jgi:hypothetical protein
MQDFPSIWLLEQGMMCYGSKSKWIFLIMHARWLRYEGK